MIHSFKAYTVMNTEEQQPLIILNVSFVIWGNEWFGSWLSCQTGHLRLFDETWMDQVQKLKVKMLYYGKNTTPLSRNISKYWLTK